MIAEVYMMRTLSFASGEGHPTTRWWVHPQILVGGSINSGLVKTTWPSHISDQLRSYPDDGAHLREDFSITGVLNTEAEQSDATKGFVDLCECGIIDNSLEYPSEVVIRGIQWAKNALQHGKI
jgi:hypothetical protein